MKTSLKSSRHKIESTGLCAKKNTNKQKNKEKSQTNPTLNEVFHDLLSMSDPDLLLTCN